MRPSIQHNNTTYYLLDELEDFPVKHGRRYEINGIDLAAFLFADRVIVVDNACPHEGVSLCGGSIHQGNIVCPSHGWQFSVEDGSAGSPTTKPVHWYPTVIQDGNVWVSLEPKK